MDKNQLSVFVLKHKKYNWFTYYTAQAVNDNSKKLWYIEETTVQTLWLTRNNRRFPKIVFPAILLEPPWRPPQDYQLSY